ncbi:MAG: hypothetical protein QW778_05170, partial [Candidatus Micrarchaeaceae archaeon]
GKKLKIGFFFKISAHTEKTLTRARTHIKLEQKLRVSPFSENVMRGERRVSFGDIFSSSLLESF